jgi:hypothetical protein
MRVRTLVDPIEESWEEHVKEAHYQNRKITENELISEYGEFAADDKKRNFIDLGAKPFSIVAFHNKFFEQIRTAFVMGAYYPALTAACSLGERILNHLILLLRDDFRGTPEYKKVCSKDSFDDWAVAIRCLLSWQVLLPEVGDLYFTLKEMRHKAIHFRPETDKNDRALAMQAIDCLQKIIGIQFAGLGHQPWFMNGIPGEIYIKREWEERPFIKRIYLRSCPRLGPKNVIESYTPKIVINDQFDYEEKEISDEEFVVLRNAALEAK